MSPGIMGLGTDLKPDDGHLDVDGGYSNGTLERITPVTIRGPAARWSPVFSPPMARPRKAEAPAPIKTLEAQLWAAADQMRGAVRSVCRVREAGGGHQGKPERTWL